MPSRLKSTLRKEKRPKALKEAKSRESLEDFCALIRERREALKNKRTLKSCLKPKIALSESLTGQRKAAKLYSERLGVGCLGDTRSTFDYTNNPIYLAERDAEDAPLKRVYSEKFTPNADQDCNSEFLRSRLSAFSQLEHELHPNALQEGTTVTSAERKGALKYYYLLKQKASMNKNGVSAEKNTPKSSLAEKNVMKVKVWGIISGSSQQSRAVPARSINNTGTRNIPTERGTPVVEEGRVSKSKKSREATKPEKKPPRFLKSLIKRVFGSGGSKNEKEETCEIKPRGSYESTATVKNNNQSAKKNLKPSSLPAKRKINQEVKGRSRAREYALEARSLLKEAAEFIKIDLIEVESQTLKAHSYVLEAPKLLSRSSGKAISAENQSRSEPVLLLRSPSSSSTFSGVTERIEHEDREGRLRSLSLFSFESMKWGPHNMFACSSGSTSKTQMLASSETMQTLNVLTGQIGLPSNDSTLSGQVDGRNSSALLLSGSSEGFHEGHQMYPTVLSSIQRASPSVDAMLSKPVSLENGFKQLTIPEEQEQEEETLLDEQKSESTTFDKPVVETSTSEKKPTLLGAEQSVESKALEPDEVLPATRKPEEGVNSLDPGKSQLYEECMDAERIIQNLAEENKTLLLPRCALPNPASKKKKGTKKSPKRIETENKKIVIVASGGSKDRTRSKPVAANNDIMGSVCWFSLMPQSSLFTPNQLTDSQREVAHPLSLTRVTSGVSFKTNSTNITNSSSPSSATETSGSSGSGTGSFYRSASSYSTSGSDGRSIASSLAPDMSLASISEPVSTIATGTASVLSTLLNGDGLCTGPIPF
jgi:hypothetical protein